MQQWANGAEAEDARIVDVDSTAVVNQAAGMLSIQLEMPVASALEWLRSYAFVHGQFVAESAADVVTRRVSFDVGDR
jgi:hypothetical protein